MVQRYRSGDLNIQSSTPGETAKTSIQLSSDDGTIFPATVYSGVNVSDDPDLRGPLMEGKLNAIESPTEKGRIYRPAVPLTYHDPEHELFALVIPDSLRHEEFRCRSELLEQLSIHRDVLPEYIRRFEVVFGPAELARLEKRQVSVSTAGPEEATMISEAPGPPLEAVNRELQNKIEELEKRLDERQRAFNETRDELQAQLEKTKNELSNASAQDDDDDDERKQLDIDRAQLEEVATRVERDSARVDEAMTNLQQERAELEHERQKLEEQKRKLQVKELNLEQEQMRLQREASFGAGDKPHAKEKTQVVTDDQFIEVVSAADKDSEVEAEVEAEAFSDPKIIAEKEEGGERRRRPEPATRTLVVYESEDSFDTFADGTGSGEHSFVDADGGLVVAGFALGDDRAEKFLDGELRFLFQLHEVDTVPVIALTLAVFDEQGQCVDAVAAPLTDDDARQRALLDQVALDLHVHLAIYGDKKNRIAVWEAGAPIRRNIGWARQRLRQWRAQSESPEASKAAAKKVAAGDVEIVGSMRHPFETQSFVEFDGVSDINLAVSIVGYWSLPDQVDYLIGNRCFSLTTFRQIQKRVVRQALHWGIVPGEELRDVALEEAIILDKVSLTERLLSNFAEVCVGLRENDLDPLEIWENWDALIQLAEEQGVTPDPDVLELAEVSLKRAQEYEEMLDQEDLDDSGGSTDLASASLDTVDLDELVDSRRAKDSGVTYFVATSTGADRFEEMMAADFDRLCTSLSQSDCRLDAAQAIIEKFATQGITEVLEAAESMTIPEVAALTRFVEVRADGLEAALMQALNSTGPAGTFVVGRSLATLGSTAALPRLLDVVRDPNRQGSRRAMANCLAIFGDKLVPPLSRALKRDPDDEDLLAVLSALEDVRQGTLDEFARDRHKGLQQAASRARQQG